MSIGPEIDTDRHDEDAMTGPEPSTTSDAAAGRPQVKVCGLTRTDEAVRCAALGADAIGCVFYPKSPRHVSDAAASRIRKALPATVKTVGVFVNERFGAIMRRVERCGLDAVQLHGQESAALVERLHREHLLVIKALFVGRQPGPERAPEFDATAYLIEHGAGSLPGGNALAWDWREAGRLGRSKPLILAGGLSPANAARAVTACLPDALDVCSGVESVPGRKDLQKVAAFMQAVSDCSHTMKKQLTRLRRIFQ